MMKNFLQNKVVWITGSGRGIGRAFAIHFAKEGACVVISSRTSTQLAEVEQKIKASEGAVLAIPCDVSQKADVDAAVKQILHKFGAVDILINNAGVSYFKSLDQLQENEWDEMMQSNCKSAFLCTQAVLPEMKIKRSGHIINVVSVAGIKPFLNCSGYCASKYGLLGFTEVMRMETREFGIRVTAFVPGATDSVMWDGAGMDRNRMMMPDDVARFLVNLTKDTSGYMVEQVILRPQGGDL